jgi:hypothetical protein
MTSLKQLNAEQLRQKNGLVHTGYRQKDDDSYLGIVGEYLDTEQNKLFYSGLLRDKDPLNNKKFVLFDKLELSPFTNDIDFKTIEKADLEVKNIFATGNLEFQSTQSIDPNSNVIINPLDYSITFEISAVTIADIFTVIDSKYTELGRNLNTEDYFPYLFDNPDLKDQDYVLVKNQINLEENGIYKLFKNSSTGYTYFRRINDEASARNTQTHISAVITVTDNGRLVRYGRLDPVYYKIKAYTTTDAKLYIEFNPYNGTDTTSYQSGSWSMGGDIQVSGDLNVDKSAYIGYNLSVGKSFFESVMNLTSDTILYQFDLNMYQACIYRCNSYEQNMEVILPDVSFSAGKNIKIIKVDSSINTVSIQPLSGQTINNFNEYIVLQSKSDHIKLTCDGYEWFTM